MKKLLAVSILLVCSIALAQGKYRWGQYPVNQNSANYNLKLHISATRFRPCAAFAINTECGEGLYADATLDGRKFEIFGGVDRRQSAQLVPGDYMAMLPKKPRYKGKAVVGQGYYVLLPDKSAWICCITGLTE